VPTQVVPRDRVARLGDAEREPRIGKPLGREGVVAASARGEYDQHGYEGQQASAHADVIGMAETALDPALNGRAPRKQSHDQDDERDDQQEPEKVADPHTASDRKQDQDDKQEQE
jgi:hypothetical protein